MCTTCSCPTESPFKSRVSSSSMAPLETRTTTWCSRMMPSINTSQRQMETSNTTTGIHSSHSILPLQTRWFHHLCSNAKVPIKNLMLCMVSSHRHPRMAFIAISQSYLTNWIVKFSQSRVCHSSACKPRWRENQQPLQQPRRPNRIDYSLPQSYGKSNLEFNSKLVD